MIVDIRAAFSERLQSLPNIPAVAWENVPFTRTTGTPYLQPNLLMAEPEQAELGTASSNRHRGIYQISIFYPSNSGTGLAFALADAICTHFRRGTRLTYNGIVVTIERAGISPVQYEPDWLHFPISIRFNTLISN